MGSYSTAAADLGRILSGRNARNTESGSFMLGDRARYQESGTIGDNNTIRSGLELNNSNLTGATVNIGDKDASRNFADTVELLTRQQAETSRDLLSAITGSGNQYPTPAELNPETKTEVTSQPWFLPAVVAAVLGLGWFILKRR